MIEQKKFQKDPNAPPGFNHRCQCSTDCSAWIKTPSKRVARGHHNKTAAGRARRSMQQGEVNKKIWAGYTDEERQARGSAGSEGLKSFWNDMQTAAEAGDSDAIEWYAEWASTRGEGSKQRWAEYSEEERAERVENSWFVRLYKTASDKEIQEMHAKRYATTMAKSPEERKEIIEKAVETRKITCANYTLEKRQQIAEMARANQLAYLASLTEEERREKFRSFNYTRPNLEINGVTITFDSSWEVPVYRILSKLDPGFLYANGEGKRTGPRFPLGNGYYWVPDFELTDGALIEVKAKAGPTREHWDRVKFPMIKKSEALKGKKIYLIDQNCEKLIAQFEDLSAFLQLFTLEII